MTTLFDAHDRPPDPPTKPGVPPDPDPPGPDVVPVRDPPQTEHPDPVREPHGDKPPIVAARSVVL